ncbi:UDP-glucosyltransferase 2-like isoform X1 [Linepithema humile]|uniref:UDP-glucosyltransferase 2-like isoform X1 n=2 Tax=Linepithema humile TaxID=83485 RepID=UPI00351E4F32
MYITRLPRRAEFSRNASLRQNQPYNKLFLRCNSDHNKTDLKVFSSDFFCRNFSSQLDDYYRTGSYTFSVDTMKLITSTLPIIVILWILATSNLASSKRLLIITPAPSYSHQIVFRALCLALNKRGHEIVVLTPNTLNDPSLTNYTEIDFGFEYEKIDDTDLSQTRWNLTQLGGLKTRLLKLGHGIAEDVLSHPDLMKYYENRTNQQFDAVIAEMIMTPAIYLLAHKFNAPLIGIMSMDLQNCHRFNFGSPVLPSHASNWELESKTGLNVSFWRRLVNFFNTWWHIYSWFNNFANRQQKIAEKYFGKDIPHVVDVAKNMSLILINQEPLLAYARPEIPNIVHFSGLHILKTPPSLSKDLKSFLDNATNGFIYMSLGTNVKSKLLPKKALEIFTNAFADLPYKVLWKFEDNNLRVSPNIFISKWIPQQGVLAHPNIKLFIYQGGLQSTEEAVHYAVPLIGIPFVFDQVYQVMKMVSLGVAKHLDIVRLTTPELRDTILEVAGDKGYKDRMLKLRALTKDKPYDSLENVIWWIEFVMRHNGAPHLRFNGVDAAWYQQFDLDVIVFLTIVTFSVLCILLVITKRVLISLYTRYEMGTRCAFRKFVTKKLKSK